jgi:hypothetical protein
MSEKSIVEKLQLKSGRTILLLNEPPSYLQILGTLPADCQFQGAEGKADVVQLFVRTHLELEDWLIRAVGRLKPGGIFWVSYPKLTSKMRSDINRDSINSYAISNGWQGVVIVSIDENWSALRLKSK